MPLLFNLKNVHKVNRWFILPFENKMFVVINIVFYYQKWKYQNIKY